jgi:hypothetical protein
MVEKLNRETNDHAKMDADLCAGTQRRGCKKSTALQMPLQTVPMILFSYRGFEV